MDDRDQAILMERASGDTLREIGDKHGLSPEGVRVVLIREATRQLNQLELDLMVADRAERKGGVAEWPTFLVPFQEQDGWQTALSYFQWVLDRLRARGVQVTVTTRQTPAGTVFQIEQGGAE